MCREEALDVTSLLNEKDEFSRFKLLAVIKEVAPTKKCPDDECLGVSDFSTKYFPDGDVFHDPSGGFWEALGSRRVTQQRLSTYNPIKVRAFSLCASGTQTNAALGLAHHSFTAVPRR